MDEDERIVVSKEDDCERLGIPVPLFICAPMVRYSKLPFRKLVRRYGVDVAYTPMIYTSNFVASEKCRRSEFTTEPGENPVVQFAAKHPEDFAAAAELVHGYASGIDLNCGCPKRDVRSAGFGSQLLDSPELIADIVRQTRARISDPDFTISVKIRIQYPIERTVDLCRKVEQAGVSHITVHARTRDMRNEPPDLEAAALIKSSLTVPMYYNGDCKSYQEALEIAQRTKTDGIMAANGLLTNPALFGGHERTPPQCVKDWVDLESSLGVPFELFHQQLVFMMRPLLSKPQRQFFHELNSVAAVKDFLAEHFSW